MTTYPSAPRQGCLESSCAPGRRHGCQHVDVGGVIVVGSGTTTCSSHLINEGRGRRHVDMGVSTVPGALEVASGWTRHRRFGRRIAGRDVAWPGEWQWPPLSVGGHSGE